jgi:hypothetical protein
MAPSKKPPLTKSTDTGAARQRKIRAEVDQAGTARELTAVPANFLRAGNRAQPSNPLPPRCVNTPGTEAVTKRRPKPMVQDYRGSHKLQNLAASSTGADSTIRVNAVAPGQEWTPLNPQHWSVPHIRKFGKKAVVKRPAHSDTSSAYFSLAAPATASYITGIVLPIMGGKQGA